MLSNQYKLKLGGKVSVFQYKLEVQGMEMWDANLVQQLIKYKRKTLDKAFGLHVVSGQQIYMLQELEEDVTFAV